MLQEGFTYKSIKGQDKSYQSSWNMTSFQDYITIRSSATAGLRFKTHARKSIRNSHLNSANLLNARFNKMVLKLDSVEVLDSLDKSKQQLGQAQADTGCNIILVI